MEGMREEHGGQMRRRGRITESTFAKITAFLVLAAGIFIGASCALGTVFLASEGYYLNGYESFVHDRMVSSIWESVGEFKGMYLEDEESIETAKKYLSIRNLSVELYEGDKLLWDLAAEEEKDTPYHFVCYTSVDVPVEIKPERGSWGSAYGNDNYEFQDTEGVSGSGQGTGFTQSSTASGEDHILMEIASTTEFVTRELTFYLYVNPDFPYTDEYSAIERQCRFLADWAYVLPVAAGLGWLAGLISFLFLLCSAGHHAGKEGISGGVLSYFHFDVLTMLFAITSLFGMYVLLSWVSYAHRWTEFLIGSFVLALGAVWVTIYLRELALRMKQGNLLRHTLLFVLFRGAVALTRGLPLVLTTAIVFCGISILELLGILLFANREVFVLWFLEKAVLFPIVLYCALMCKKLQQGSEALAEGNLGSQVDTSYMVLSFKQHGENLNSIAQGMTAAVEQRMKSEHLRTELITNVSHDLKTPLTSIINYADLIGNLLSQAADGENGEFSKTGGVFEVSHKVTGEEGLTEEITEKEREMLSEYTEVLLRQSKRLKKLLDDLIEASKATTGNLEVQLQPCELGVLLSQAVGEYEQRFEEKGLELITGQPEEPVTVLADGRHIWRVFDNLLNNVCKYAQEGSRVYLTVDLEQRYAEIIFRNMSKFALNITGDELRERFVRGDKSRHMEGSGLGLSIASSLMELQGGSMEIVTDGDLFKVILDLPLCPAKQNIQPQV